MTRIGRCQVKPTLYWQCIPPARQSRPAQNFQTKRRRSISVCQPRLAALSEWADSFPTLTPPDPQAFFENRIVADAETLRSRLRGNYRVITGKTSQAPIDRPAMKPAVTN
jgi:hypothetical protein